MIRRDTFHRSLSSGNDIIVVVVVVVDTPYYDYDYDGEDAKAEQ